jgi:hypothetical protein
MQMRLSRFRRAGAVAAVCALVGAAAGIAGSAAAPSGHKTNNSDAPGEPHAGMIRMGGPPIHAELVVPNSAGNGFDTVTMDTGAFKSLSGDQLTITEGTKTATYKVVTLTIPSNATVYRNDAKAQLSDLKDGDTVHVKQGAGGTTVFANDAQHQPEFRTFGKFRHFRGGPGAPGEAGQVPAPPMTAPAD